MGFGAFLYATNFSKNGIVGTGIISPGPFFFCLTIRVVEEVRFKRRTGSWFKREGSRVMTPEGKIIWETLIPLSVNVATNVLYLIVLTLGWKFAKASGLNQGVISTLLSLASFFNLILFYFKFGEKISCSHFLGIILMLACVICISMAATTGKDLQDFDSNETFGLSQVAAGVVAILCGFTGAVLMSTKHLFIRIYKSNYSGVDMGIDSSIIEFFLLSFFLIPLLQVEGFTIGINELAIGTASGILICSGRILISIGISVGLAAPAQALMSTHALHQAFWSAMFAG